MPEAGSDRDLGVLFDLDGTFADTAPDMASALNHVLCSAGQAPRPLEEIRPHVSHGGKALIRLGFGLTPEDPEFDRLRRAFLDAYQEHIYVHTRLFPGMDALLEALDSRGVPWGIVTNKPAWLTEPLMRHLGMSSRAACIVSGDTTSRAKPHPEPIRHACRQIDRPAARCWYVGDAQRDIEAGRQAGTRTLVALFGYLSDTDRPDSWGADGMVRDPLEILAWLAG
jgi:phosphoglycolate phosphatase